MRRLTRKRLAWVVALLSGAVGLGPVMGERHYERYGGRPWRADAKDRARR